jgi:hypothetical protein
MRFQVVLSVEEDVLGSVLASLQRPNVDVNGIGPEESSPIRKKRVKRRMKTTPAKKQAKSKPIKRAPRRKGKGGVSGIDVIEKFAKGVASFKAGDIAYELGKNGLSPKGASPAIGRAIKAGVIKKIATGVFQAVQS